MIQFIETLRLENSRISNRLLHRQRLFETVKFHYGQKAAGIAGVQFDELLSSITDSAGQSSAVQKLRVIYADTILHYELQNYILRTIKSLKIVVCDSIEYSYKYHNRDAINKLLEQKGYCDDILICRNGYITDTSFSNVVFENKEGLFTPETFLLNGTMRQRLLKEGTVKEADISIDKLGNYDNVILINSMLSPDISEPVPVRSGIVY